MALSPRPPPSLSACFGLANACSETTGNLCFEKDDLGATQTDWTYVGEGRGRYEIARGYNYVGDGRGSYEKEGTEKLRVRQIWVRILALLAAVSAIAGVACVMGAGSLDHLGVASAWRTLGSGASHYDCEAPDVEMMPEDQQRWCCAHWGRACQDDHERPEFNCEDDKDWSPGKKSWCCANYGRGCSFGGDCAIDCSFHGVSAPCGARIQWAAAHNFAGQANACERSHSAVREQCPACAACDVASAGCTALPVATPATTVASTAAPLPAFTPASGAHGIARPEIVA